MTKIDELRQWVDQYKNEDEANRVGQAGAIKAMDYFIKIFSKNSDDLNGNEISLAQKEVERCIEILKAFTGRIAIMALMQDMKKEKS